MMPYAQIIVFGSLLLALGLFIWGKPRHDLTALICLIMLVVSGVVPPAEAFAGFAHPAVITVAMILIVSHGLQRSGLIDLLGKGIMRMGKNLTLQVAALCFLVCLASGFMNNVGALAIIMPVAIHIAHQSGHSPSLLLMPIAAASLLGGMMTLIGTPPNIIIANYRSDAMGSSFSMFDFAPVGIGLSLVGLLFIALIGWRLLPRRVQPENRKDKFHMEDYVTEILVSDESKIADVKLSDVYRDKSYEIQLLSLIRNNHFFHAPPADMKLKKGDVLMIQADTDDLKTFIETTGASLMGRVNMEEQMEPGREVEIVEAVVMKDGLMDGQTATKLHLRAKYGINLLAVSRQNVKLRKRLGNIVFKPGDVLLLQGEKDRMREMVGQLGCLRLADRGFRIEKKQRLVQASLVFAASLALVISGLLPVEIAFTIAAVGMVLLGIVPLQEMYKAVDWPVIVLLGAMLPLGTALESSGGAGAISSFILSLSGQFPAWVLIGAVIFVTLLLSNVINNAATAVLMAPIAVGIANGLNASVDPFLMAIAVGASAAFLTPIGHQSNTLVMGPGGYAFRDYFKFGLPVTILVLLAAVPLILYFWPL